MPLQVIEETDPLTNLIRFQTSPVYEMIISLQTLIKPGRHIAWAESTRAALSPDFEQELRAVYEPFWKGIVFFELAVDYADHHDVTGFIEYVRHMAPVDFMFYIVGRIISREAIAATGLVYETLLDVLQTSASAPCWVCHEVPLNEILVDIPAFQHRLADLWQRYWDAFFAQVVFDMAPHWDEALHDKHNMLARLGGQGLLEKVAHKKHLPELLPPDQPITEIVFIPLYKIASSAFMFYGYGNVTVLFDSEQTESRLAEIERGKQQAVAVLKALGDPSRLDILRLVAHFEGSIHGKKIAAKLELSASAVSRHLNQLKDAGLLMEETADNRTITYRLQRDVITSLPERLLDYLYSG